MRSVKNVRYITFIRHGKKVSEAGNPPLTKLGLEQARKTGTYLSRLLDIPKPSLILASPKLRTQQTAEEIAKIIGTPFTTHAGLVERMDWEDNTTLNYDEFVEMWLESTKDRTWKPPIGDSSYRAGKRMLDVVKDAGTLENHAHIVFVTHGGVIADFLRNIFTLDELRIHNKEFAEKFEETIRECSVTHLTKDGNRLNIHTLISTEHLK